MELRSNRSRSKTPFLVRSSESFDKKEIIEKGNHVEKSFVKTTTIKMSQSIQKESLLSSNEFEIYETQPEKSTTRRSTRNKVVKTSDYSSEDGENEYNSSRTISQNERNQLIEDARAAANGSSGISALDLYRKSGRYWEVYPKTDWTYSQHSKDRVEIAPGVVAMPNMSRRTIHSINDSNITYSDNVSHKNINTDAVFLESQKYASKLESEVNVRRRLFNNNREDVFYKKERYGWMSVWQRFKRVVQTVLMSILTVFYSVFDMNVWLFKYLYRLSTWVMLMDTYLLCKSWPKNKGRALFLLCFIPMALLGGWWLLFTAGNTFLDSYFRATETDSMPLVPILSNDEYNKKEYTQNFKDFNGNKGPEIIKIVEKVYVEPPTAEEIVKGLSDEQIKKIGESFRNSFNINDEINTEEIVEKIILSPTFQNIINNYNNVNIKTDGSRDGNFESILKSNEDIINNLRVEINNLKDDIVKTQNKQKNDFEKLILDLKNENYMNNAKLTYELNKCCRKPIINIENYVNRILSNLLNNPEFLKNQKGLNEYLHTIFIAKQDLETHLHNLTSNLNYKFNTILDDNTKKIMDEITSKLSYEMNKNLYSKPHDSTTSTTDCISDDHVKTLVKTTLATYDADKTGLVDFAMETMGGTVVTTRCTENYPHGKAVVSVLGIPLWYPVNSPRTVITPSINPGECWAFQSFPGFLVIKLSNKIYVEAFSMEHISKLLVPDGRIDSAPKEFEVYGLKEENDKSPVLLGSFKYEYDGEPLQYFLVEKPGVFDMVELRVVSNHGNPNYTCLYRFRVHGRVYHGET